MKDIKIIPIVVFVLTMLTAVIVVTKVMQYRELSRDKFVTSVNYKKAFTGKNVKKYTTADVQRMKATESTRTDRFSSNAYETNQFNHTGSTITQTSEPVSTNSGMATQSGKVIAKNGTDKFHKSTAGNQSSGGIVSVVNYKDMKNGTGKPLVAGKTVSGSMKQAAPIQKAGGKPGEPGLGSLPLGDGTWILLSFVALFGIKKRLI
jgi:hypothetical protein